ncbi:hypothetical protein BCR32DRAFT_269175 [Anaeromyces robustus]|jgi:hypothetical protein|uniref:Uncharacterized protein n=1 Tax=Anaeromyces robustus TaxID=1754192 RepID=A0A1Y1X3J4_9FUNG|nr:hypothetical protein BCR32DRAFT_269175 [Anaeromyces robustus]|eukprot:ORX79884.1 hypothetical protein BCR32DRAFT_269175 [Anaeromyces robustus]
MKTLNFLAIIALCFMAISHVSATYYIIKTFENYGDNSTKGDAGTLKESGNKRVECFAGLIGSKVNKPDAILFKADGTTKDNQKKVNSKRYTAEAIANKIGGITAEEVPKTAVATITDVVKDKANVLFVWSDKEKAQELATNLGVANAPEFPKENYGHIWVIENGQLTDMTMDCADVKNEVVKEDDDKMSSASSIRLSIMSVAVAIMASLYFLF